MHHSGVDVIGVLMRDQQGVRARDRISSAPDARVDHDLLAVTVPRPDGAHAPQAARRQVIEAAFHAGHRPVREVTAAARLAPAAEPASAAAVMETG